MNEGAMEKETIKLNVSEARDKLTQLDKLLKPGDIMQITRRGKAYARMELMGEIDPYEEVLNSIEALPEPENTLQPVARRYKSFLYGMNDEDFNRF